MLLNLRAFEGLTEGNPYGSCIQFNMICKAIVLFLNREVTGEKKKVVKKIFLIAIWDNGDKLRIKGMARSF